MSAAAPHILMVEDEENIAFSLKLNLELEGYEITHVDNGRVALETFLSNPNRYALVILDVMLPEMNGFAIAEKIREADIRTGIIMLTAKATDEDQIRGLSTGVDDYMTKPFSLDELLLRVKRMVARSQFLVDKPPSTDEEPIKYSDFRLDPKNLHIEMDGEKHSLTELECKILQEFFAQPGETLSRQYLLEKVWGMSAHVATRTVDNFIVRLRKIVEADPSHPEILLSVRGKGYRLKPAESIKESR